MSNTFPEFLIFQLYGNLSSWGDIAVGEHRPSQSYPSKSAIMGLLAAALGIRRDEDKKHLTLNGSYGVSICVYSHGELLRDYQTTQVPAGNNHWMTRKDELCFNPLGLKTILSQRDYLMDAYYQVAIWCKDQGEAPYRLSELSKALRKPKFTTSLGRKSCPPCLPYKPTLFEKMSLKSAYKAYEIDQDIKYYLCMDDLTSWYWEEGLSNDELGMKHVMSYPRRDRVTSRKRWQFTNRNEYAYSEQREGGSKCTLVK